MLSSIYTSVSYPDFAGYTGVGVRPDRPAKTNRPRAWRVVRLSYFERDFARVFDPASVQRRLVAYTLGCGNA